MSLLHY